MRIDGQDVSDDALTAAFQAIEAARGSTTLTYFEYGTLAALKLFGDAGLDLAVLEVGLGGRLDAVNIVDADVAVITTVDIDHSDWLGEDREAIGVEKAGIIRGWKPVILGETDPPSSVLARAYLLGANAIRGGSDFFVDVIDAQTWCWRDVGFRIELPTPALRGPIQLRNAASAIAALRTLDMPLSRTAIAEGVAAARIRGRLQGVDRGGVEVLVDVGHNPQAARELAAALKAAPVSGRTVAVFAALQDKDAVGVVQAMAGQVDAWHLAGLDGARAQSAQALQARLQDTAAASARRHATVADALGAAVADAAAGDRVLAFGSFHTAAQALQWLDAAG